MRKGRLEREIVIMFAIGLVLFGFFKSITRSSMPPKVCTGTCGGFAPGHTSTGCSEGCKCGKGDPMIADEIVDCVPI